MKTRRRLEVMEKPEGAREKCGPGGLCWFIEQIFTEPNRKGINLVFVASIEKLTERYIGVAFKKTDDDRGVLFGFCPMCGESLEFMLSRPGKKIAAV